MEGLETTIYYAAGETAPDAYDAGDSLRDRVSRTRERLVDDGFVEQSRLAIEPTRLGRLASQ